MMQQLERTFSPAAATILATEHWNLLGTRSMAWNETFSRATVFLTTLSASAVALALVADATAFGDVFDWFALVLFPIVLFIGLSTYVRLVQINVDDVHLVLAMNRLRRAYVDMAPEVEQYLTTGYTDDGSGLWRSYLIGRPRPERVWPRLLVSTPTLIATLDAIIAAAGGAYVAARVSAQAPIVIGVAATSFILTSAVLMVAQIRIMQPLRRGIPARFPSAANVPAPIELRSRSRERYDAHARTAENVCVFP